MKELNKIILIFLAAAFIAFSSLIMPATALAGVKIDSPANGGTVGGIVPITITYWGTATWPVYYVSCSPGGAYYESYVLSQILH